MGKREIGNELPEIFEFKNKGDSIEGIYDKKLENVGKNKANMYLLDTKEGKRSVWGSTVLNNKMDDAKIGEKITITYLGETEGANTYHNFKVEVDDPEEE